MAKKKAVKKVILVSESGAVYSVSSGAKGDLVLHRESDPLAASALSAGSATTEPFAEITVQAGAKSGEGGAVPVVIMGRFVN